jgi:hypothetical protein
LTRRAEAELSARVKQAIDPKDYEGAFAAGSDFSHREAVALARGDR